MTTTTHLGSFYYEMSVSWKNKDTFYNLPLVELEEDKIDDEFLKKFEEDYDSLHPEIKKRLASSGVMVHSKKEAEDLMKISKAFSALFTLTEKPAK